MAQKLIQPINREVVTASYKWGTAYQNRFGFVHYGQDMVGNDTVYSQGDGVVVFAGWDNVCGNVVGIRYDTAENHFDGGAFPVIGRYFHFASINVRTGQRVSKDTRLGIMGATGQYVAGKHLHVEMDRDIEFPAYTPTLAGNSNLLKAGLRGSQDTTVDPMRMTFTKVSPPDNQSIALGDNSSWVDPRDAKIPQIR